MRSAAFDNWSAKARAMKIEDEIARRGIKLRGKVERVGPCPKCGGTDRFSINTKKGLWNCRQCGVGGDVIKLVEHLDGVDFIGACTTLTGELAPKANGRGQRVEDHTQEDRHRNVRVPRSERRPRIRGRARRVPKCRRYVCSHRRRKA